jgi:hypothetical protein
MDGVAFPSPELYWRYMSRLLELGITRIETEFSGSGDSGDIDYAVFFSDAGEVQVGDQTIKWPKKVGSFNQALGGWQDTVIEEDVPFKHVTYDIARIVAQSYDYDWWNNDGGYGQLILRVVDGQLEADIDFHIRYTEVNSYSHKLNSMGLLGLGKE